VFISYVVVVAAGALPTWFYLSDAFEVQLARSFARDAASRVRLLAVMMEETEDAQRPNRLKELSPVFIERVTLIQPKGQVSFDSSVDALNELDDHSKREEVQRALGTLPSAILDEPIDGVGAARRTSQSTGVDTLYVAAALKDGSTIRLALPLSRVGVLSSRVLGAFRNSVAFSITVAIFLSLVAALVFSRPLRKIAHRAVRIAKGDYEGEPLRRSADELGDVIRALDRITDELSSREAVAEAAISTLEQVVSNLSIPLALLDPDEHLLAASPAAYEWAGDGRTLAERLSAWTETEEYMASCKRMRKTFTSQTVSIGESRVTLTPISRPGGPPLTILAPAKSQSSRRKTLSTDAIRVLSGRKLLLSVWPSLTMDQGDCQIVDIGGRAMTALLHLKRVMPDAVPDSTTDELSLHLTLDGFLPSDEASTIAQILQPIGGQIHPSDSYVHVRLAMA
jgi:two-component system phosphate regulon sensor histidine kinase PhoR